MRELRPPTRRHRSVAGLRLLAVLAASTAFLVACDTGDGKTLSEPTGTLPPPTTTTEVPLDGGGTLASLPLEAPDVGDVGDAAGGELGIPSDVDPGEFRLIAPWPDGAGIDPRYSCDSTEGSIVSPALSWAAVPDGTVEIAISMIDESISNGPPFVHWVIAGINPDDISLIENTVPLGAIQAINGFGDVAYGAPCPPPDDAPHDYRFTVYALGQQTELADGTPSGDLLDFVQTVSIASADVLGTYGR